MDAQKELLDAMYIIAEGINNSATPQILFGVVTAVATTGNKCTMAINGVSFVINYYGSNTPSINQKYPIFVPAGGMHLAFIQT